MAHSLPADLIIAILFGIPQVLIGVASLWQQWYLGRITSEKQTAIYEASNQLSAIVAAMHERRIQDQECNEEDA
jgi:hypothetical protein